MEALAFLIVTGGVYMLPTIIGAARQRHNLLAIGALNVLLGWTLLGWVVALVWALTSNPPGVSVAPSAPAGDRPRSLQDSEANLSRARVWIAVVAVIVGLGAWGHFSQSSSPGTGPPSEHSAQN